MKYSDLGNQKLKPMKDLVALKWIPRKKMESGIFLPDTYFDFGLKLGQMYVCKVMAVGPKVKQVKPGDQVLLHEYSLKTFPGTWQEDTIYFTEEANLKAKVSGIKGLITRVSSKKEEKVLEETEVI